MKCSIDGCEKPRRKRGWCGMHYQRWKRHGDVVTVARSGRPKGTLAGTDSPSWRGADISYGGAHLRVRRVRGAATAYACAHCLDVAAEWAYDHADPAERTGLDHGHVRPYSTDPAHYLPLCVPCHRSFDYLHSKEIA